MTGALRDLRSKSRERRHQPMKRVVQQTGTSCGVACVAMLARLSYREAFKTGLALWDEEHWAGTHRTDAAELRKMLATLGWRLGRRVNCTDWHKVPPAALVAVQWKEPKNEWHWVVSAADAAGLFFFDPLKTVKTTRRRDFTKAPPSWYHLCHPE